MAGAALHHVSVEVVEAARARRAMAKRTQKMMVAILLDRRIQENFVFGEGPDRGSDAGDDCTYVNSCMELAPHHDIEPEPPGCDGNDVNARKCAVDHPCDHACVQSVHSCMNSLDDVFDDGC